MSRIYSKAQLLYKTIASHLPKAFNTYRNQEKAIEGPYPNLSTGEPN